MIFAGACASANALDFNDRFYGKAQANVGYYAGFYSGDVKNAIDDAKNANEDNNSVSHSISAGVGFNVFYKLNDKVHPFAGLNVEGKYAFKNEFVKDNKFQNFLNVNAKLGSSFKVSKDLDVRPYALVGMSVNQYKTKEQTEAINVGGVNRLYGTPEQNGNGKYDAALAYAQYNNIFTSSNYYDPNTIKVYTSNNAFDTSIFNMGPNGGTALYSNVENLNTGNGIDNFTNALASRGINYFDASEQLLEDGIATSNILRITRITDGLVEAEGFAFFDYSHAIGLPGDFAGSEGGGTFEQRLSSFETNEGYWQNWMDRWLAIQIETNAPSNVKDRFVPVPITGENAQTAPDNALTANESAPIAEENVPAANESAPNAEENVPAATDSVNQNTNQNNANNNNQPRAVTSNKASYNVGLNVGAGVEFVIKDRFTVGVEYRYTDVKITGVKFQTHNVGAKFGVEFL